MEVDWEDEALKLKLALQEAKKFSNKQVDDLKQARARELKLERKLSALPGTGGVPRNKENEEMIVSLQRANNKLKERAEGLSKRNASLVTQLEKKDRQLSLASRRIANLKAPSPVRARAGVPTPARPTTAPMRPTRHEQLREEQQKQGDVIQPSISFPPQSAELAAGTASGSTSLSVSAKDASPVRGTEAAASSSSLLASQDDLSFDRKEMLIGSTTVTHRHPRAAAIEAQSHAKVKQMQQRYDLLNSKFDEELIKNKHMSVQLLEYIEKVKLLRASLEELRAEKSKSDEQGIGAEDMQAENEHLRLQVAKLEERVSHLCSISYGTTAADDEEGLEAVEKLQMERDDLKSQVSHLEDAVRTNFTLAESAKAALQTTRGEKEALEAKLEETIVAYHELETKSNFLQDKLKLYSEDDGLDHDELDRALTSIRRAGTTPTERPGFLEGSADTARDDSPAILKRRIQELQQMAVDRDKERQRLQTMLKLESSLNKDLRLEIEGLTARGDADSKEHVSRMTAAEELAKQRLDKIKTLEAQIRQMVYSAAGKGYDALMAGVPPEMRDKLKRDLAAAGRPDAALLADLLHERGAQLQPDENLLEVWVKSAEIRSPLAEPDAQTFVVVDFLDFESQATQLMDGNAPKWDFAATFKITVDDFLLRYLAGDTMSLELGMVAHGKHTTLARAALPMSSLLQTKASIVLEDHPFLSLVTNEVVATVKAEIKLALPVSELFRLFCERNPTEAAQLKQRGIENALEAQNKIQQAKIAEAAKLGADDDAALWNEMELCIESINDVITPSQEDEEYLPSPYLHFQLMGFREHLTSVIANTRSAKVNERFVYAMATSETQLRTMRRSALDLTLWDMNAESDDNNKNGGLLGHASLDLKELSLGIPIRISLPVRSAEDSQILVGSINLTASWVHPFYRARGGEPLVLTGPEVEQLMRAFGDAVEDTDENKRAGRGTIFYGDLLYHMTPPDVVVGVMEKLREYALDISRREGLSMYTIFSFLVEPDTLDGERVEGAHFVTKMGALSVDVLPNEYTELFKHIDRECRGEVMYADFLSVMNPVGPAGVSMSILEKISNRCSDLVLKGITPDQVFASVSSSSSNTKEHGGRLSRYHFEEGLSRMGFELLDRVTEEGGLEEPPPEPAPSKRAGGAKGIVATDNMLDGLSDAAADIRDDNSDYGVERGYLENMQRRAAFEEEKQRVLAGAADVDTSGPEPDMDMASGAHGHVRELDSSVMATAKAAEDKVSSIRAAESARLEEQQQLVLAQQHQQQQREQVAPPQEDQFSLANAEAALQSMGNGSAQFMLRARSAFSQTDRRHMGTLPREQFGFMLNTLTDGRLEQGFVDTLASFFSPDSHNVHYSALLKMCNFKSGALPKIIAELGRSVLTSNTKRYFLDFLDTRRAGLVDASAFITTARGLLGHSMRRDEEVALINIFEGPVSGFVDYPNFISSMEGTRSQKGFEATERDFFEKLTKGDDVTQARIRFWFDRLAGRGESSFGLKDLQKSLHLLGITTSEAMVHELLFSMSAVCQPNAMDKASKRVSMADFDDWVSVMRDPMLAQFDTTAVTLSGVRRKALACFTHSATVQNFTYDALLECFHLYDWQSPPSGFMAREPFTLALTKAGFLFNRAETVFLADRFAAQESTLVEYNDFLAFACPQEILTNAVGLSGTGALSATLVKESLLSTMNAGADVLSALRNMDVVGTGLISPQEFCEAVATLPDMNAITTDEALAVGGLLDALSDGNLILYRKLVHGLLVASEEAEAAASSGDADPLKVLDAALGEAGVSLRRLRVVLEYYDRKQKGCVAVEDFPTVLEEVGCAMKQAEVQALCLQYNVEGWVMYRGILSNLDARRASNNAVDAGSELIMPNNLVVRLTSGLNELVARGIDFRAEIDAFDPKHQGSMSIHDVHRALCDTLDLKLSKEDVAIIVRCHTVVDTSTRIPTKRFNHVKFIRDHHSPLRPEASAESDHTAAAQMADELRLKVFKRYGRKELRRPFAHFARRRGEAAANMNDLSVGLADLGIEPSASELEALYRLMAPMAGQGGSRGGIRFADFVVFVCDPYFSDVEDKFYHQWVESGTGVNGLIAALNIKDTNSSGIIGIKQFDDALHASGLQLSPTDTSRLSLRFDANGDGHVDIERFFGYVRTLSRTRTGFDADTEDNSPDAIAVATIIDALKRRIEGMLEDGKSERSILDLFDMENGQLDLRLLQTGVRRLGQDVSRAIARSLLRKLMLNVGGALVDASNLLHALGVGAEAAANERPVGPASMDAVFRQRPDLMAGLIEAMTPLEPEGFTLDVLERELTAADRYELGQLERIEFTLCLKRVGIQLRPDVERDLAVVLGEVPDASGAGVDYKAFVDCVRGFYFSKLSVGGALQEMRRVVARAVANGRALEAIYDEIDRDRDNELGVEDMTRYLGLLGFSVLGRPQVLEVMQRISPSVGHVAVRFTDFERFFGPEAEGMAAAAEASQGPFLEESDDDPLTALQKRLSSDVAALNPRQRARYTQVLGRRHDLTFHDLAPALESLALNIDQSEVDVLFDHLCDPSGEGTVVGGVVLDFLGLEA